MAIEIIPVPDLGGAGQVEVIEVCVAVGDQVEAEQSLLVLESDKASMEVPCPQAGKVVSLKVKEGDSITEGDAILELEVAAGAEPEVAEEEAPAEKQDEPVAAAPAPAAPAAAAEQMVTVPDLGGADQVEVIELCVAEGDEIQEGDSLVALESDKASMEVPSPFSGKIVGLKLAVGDKVSVGDPLALMLVAGAAPAPAAPEVAAAPAPAVAESPSKAASAAAPPPVAAPADDRAAAQVAGADGGGVYAGPAVRKLARQLGVDLTRLKPSGPRARFTKEDVRTYVKQLVADVNSGKVSVSGGSGIPPIPEVDFAQFGDIELVKMSKIAKATVTNMSRAWLNVPHVTQFDEADITELEAFRKSMKAEADKRGVKLTPLPFLMKATAAALAAEPSFNVSLHADGEHKVQKKYIHIGMAVDTPAGLMVPVIRDVDKKGLWELAAETAAMAEKARAGKLMPRDMQGGCFTISSLGAMGGTGFTPIVNAPEVAIMGVSKAQIKPIWNGSEFEPRQMLPLAVSYDHRAINGGDCGRFFTYLVSVISDIRRLLL
ncbi:dihydrolipoyllysine-residue acetyltransferase [Pseudomaricurvus sp. HS19]|uniref:dihydrolipoyllysine-residue acetyltransferase n=1 Tax=Pseudomaricurvus sp. HS19 TaxID=2692626 RepID=UPI00136FEE4D|nr:dihydrolipoyllysine-residue acetyltransferase [Pseudomaricurvus sp. HS19]